MNEPERWIVVCIEDDYKPYVVNSRKFATISEALHYASTISPSRKPAVYELFMLAYGERREV